MSEQVLIDRARGVLTLTLNRPEKKNALTPAIYEALGGAIKAAEAGRESRVVLIQAAGDTFTAGNDIAEFAAATAGQWPERFAAQPLLEVLAETRIPIVAAVHGRAVGIGLTMLLHCDLVFVAEDAELSCPFVNLALTPEAASSLLLPARIGYARAFAMFTLGQAVDGRTAAAWGIANAALPADQVQAAARRAAEELAARPPAAVAATKALMREPAAYAARLEAEFEKFAAQLRSAEAREAFAAFMEKRPADFSKL